MSNESMPESVPGIFGWNELITTDVQKAKEFYKKVFSWESETMNFSPGVDYTMFKKGEKMVGGMVQITEEMGPVPPHWMNYVNSIDIESDVQKAKDAGATILKEPMEIPNAGVLAVIQDPQGAVFSLWKSTCEG